MIFERFGLGEMRYRCQRPARAHYYHRIYCPKCLSILKLPIWSHFKSSKVIFADVGRTVLLKGMRVIRLLKKTHLVVLLICFEVLEGIR